MKEDVIKILEFAVFAPSGDNSQPWDFEFVNEKLKIYIAPQRDNQILNYKNSASLIAVGALIENIKIAASNFDYEIQIIENTSETDKLVAEITFTKKEEVEKDKLFDFIKSRHTNRAAYTDDKLSAGLKSDLLNSPKELGFGEIKIEEEKNKRQILGKCAANAEIVILENKYLHKNLFENIAWSESQEKELKHGLYINAMGFNPVQKIMFKLASIWSFMKIAIKIGLPAFIASEDAKLYATGSAICLICLENYSKTDFVKAGRLFQKTLLKITANGYDAQPITATLFLGKIVRDENCNKIFSAKHIDLMLQSYLEIQKVFDVKNQNMFMMFRVGKSNSKAVATSRYSLEAFFKAQ